jgi:hypothetical protein
MAGLVPAIHVLLSDGEQRKAWMPGTSPGMTKEASTSNAKRPRLFKPRAYSCYIGNQLSGQETGLLFLPMKASRFCL